ncbi:MAG TPA: hydroxymethylbilane synthase [Chthoniobacterales bacterium]
MADHIVLGSRGSALARAQTDLVEQALRKVWPRLIIDTSLIKTSGDESSVGYGSGRKGLFTAEIERELLAARIDVAVHSAKDLPSEPVPGLEVRAALARANADDVLITRNPGGFAALPSDAYIATGSVRRQYQLRRKYPGVRLKSLRGNVPTRLRKLHEHGEWDGIVLARAGLARLGHDLSSGTIQLESTNFFVQILPTEDFLPAGGQGVIALEVRSNDKKAKRFVDAINDRETLACLRAEREFLRLLHGDCDSPVGVQARCEGDSLRMRAQVFESKEKPPLIDSVEGRDDDPEGLAAQLMKKLYGR